VIPGRSFPSTRTLLWPVPCKLNLNQMDK
jgi:hypothetical protein